MDFKNIPILGELDFSDPEKKKRSILICMAAALLILASIVALAKKAEEKEEAPAVPESSYESLQLPLGQSKEELQGKTIRDISARRGTKGGQAKDLFSDDPLADLMGEGKGTGSDSSGSSSNGGDDSGSTQPEFMRRHATANTDIFPEREEKPVMPAETQKPQTQSTAKKQQTTPAASASSNTEDLSNLSFEERRKLLYAQNGLDPETGEPAAGGPFDASRAQQNGGASSGSGTGGGSSSRKSSSGSGSTTQQTASQPAAESTAQQEDTPEQPRAQIRRSGGVSSFGSSAGKTIISISDQDIYVDDDPSHPIKVKFSYDQKVKSGQRISLRLCEDMIVDGILLPTNTHIFATCSVGERLLIQVNSIEVNGKIHNVKYTAYDNDGVEGLYCPQSTTVKATEQAAEQAGQLAQSAVQGAITGYPGRIIQAGAQLVRTAKGSTAVNVTAGYAFFLMQDN